MIRKQVIFTIALTLIACGPPRLATDSNSDSSDAEESGSDSTSMSTTDPDPSGTTDDSTTTTTFVPEPDVIGGDDCHHWLQDCPEGEKCVPYASSGGTWDANKCVPLLGDQAVGEPCEYAGPVEATDNCDATSMCWNVDAEGMGTCHLFCVGTPDNPTCPEASDCTVSGSGIINVCIPRCDPLAQDCKAGLGCYWDGGGFICASSTVEIPAGEPCGFINDCAPGLICLDAVALPDCLGSSCCSPYCDIELGDGQCEAVPGTSCVPMFEEGWATPSGAENVGYCVVS